MNRRARLREITHVNSRDTLNSRRLEATILMDVCVRTLEPRSYGVRPLAVALDCRPSLDVVTYVIEETYPEGWTVSIISDGGADSEGAIRWLFLDGEPRVLRYEATPSETSAGPALFDGAISSDGTGFRTTPTSGAMVADKAVTTTTTTIPPTVPPTTVPTTSEPPRMHPADRGRRFRVTVADVLAMATDWLAGRDGALADVPPGLRLRYLLRAAHIIKSDSQGLYHDGPGDPPDNWVPGRRHGPQQ